MFEAIRDKLRSDLSKTYKRDLKSVYREFRDFLLPVEAEGSILDIQSVRIEKFLSQFFSSGTYYMNKRRNLGVILSAAGRLDNQDVKAVKETKRKKTKAKLHKAYDKSQIRPILNFCNFTILTFIYVVYSHIVHGFGHTKKLGSLL
jgi:hypothetical protein